MNLALMASYEREEECVKVKSQALSVFSENKVLNRVASFCLISVSPHLSFNRSSVHMHLP